MTDVLGRVLGRRAAIGAARAPLSDSLRDAFDLDLSAPPPLLLLPLRVEYRVVETNRPIRVSGNVRELLRNDAAITLAAAPHVRPEERSWRLDATTATFNTRREIWFRWFPDDDFSLRGIAPVTEAESAALARFDTAVAGKPWHSLDDPAVVSGWQSLSREMEPQRALHLLRHRTDPGDPNHLDVLGQMALLPEKVALFAMNTDGHVGLLGEGSAIDTELRYSFAALESGGWLTDFDVALKAGMGLRLTAPSAVSAALDASWVIAVGISGTDGIAGVTSLLDDAVANGTFAFLPQDTPTNNTPNETTSYRAPHSDLIGFLRTAADAEKGVLASPVTQSAELFAEALGVDVSHVATAPHSGDLDFENARAMVRAIGPALIDTAVDHIEALRGISENEIIDLFADAAVARGPLPPVRFGKNPYGVLPVIKLAGLTPLASDTDRQKRIEAFVRNFSLIVGNEAQSLATSVPVIQPGDADAAEKLETILKLNPVSRRLEVETVLQHDARSLGCAYVTSEAHPAATYLADLSRKPISELPDPTFEDTTYPLLYRLARLSLSKATIHTGVKADLTDVRATLNLRVHLTESETRHVDTRTRAISEMSLSSLTTSRAAGIGESAAAAMRVASGRLLAALQRLEAIALEPDGNAKLETLLMETIDLFQHRIDAWATGVAYRRLVKRRRAGGTGLVGGYWGILGKLRPASVTGRTDGYLQAPSPHQAVTAAVLRSAHLRHSGSGAFAIGLDSRRARRGLKLLEMLQAGLSLSETLGYLAERKLHDERQDTLAFKLRDLFPLRDPRDDTALEIRLSDGLAFVGADLTSLVSPAEAAALSPLQADLRKDLDALSDVVVAEATHMRSMGRADAANAWLQVLSGETIPGNPTVLRTRRNGHGSSHRVVVLVEPAEPGSEDSPRAIAEPALAAIASERLAGFESAFASVAIASDDGGPPTLMQFTLKDDLGLAPIDLVVSGESEIVLRARHRMISLWQNDSDLRDVLGPLPEKDIITFINKIRPVTIDLDSGDPTPRSLIQLASDLRKSVTQGRMLEPGDLSAAADPAERLTDRVERDLLLGSSQALRARAAALASRLTTDVAALSSAVGPFIAAARNHRRLVDDRADAATVSLAMSQLEALRPALDAALLGVSYYAEPGALRLFTTSEIATDPDDADRSLVALLARLGQKSSALASALAVTAAPVNAAAARAERNSLIDALKGSLDRDALPILPPIERVPATTPLVEPGTSSVASALADWKSVRAKLARVSALFSEGEWSAYSTSDASTAADDAEADERADEGLAPRARLFGTFISREDPSTTETFTGFAADEWAENRPSRTQQTGIAINYDSPQSEPPHALLLCEPAGPGSPEWSPQGAAEMVAEVIGLMKLRSLAANAHPVPGPLLPFANQVPYKQEQGTGSKPRIPVRDLRFIATADIAIDSTLLVSASESDVGVAGAGLIEITGFSKVKE